MQYVRILTNSAPNSVKGEKYFVSKQNHGVFVRPDRVHIGDFPVEEINFDDDEEM